MFSLIIVDDDEILLDGLAEAFDWASLDIRVAATATDGESALGILREADGFDIMLTDIKMGSMDGFELTAEARALFPDTRVVIMSAYEEFSYAQQAVRMAVTDYLVKPIDLAQLEATMKRIVRTLTDEREREAQYESIHLRMKDIGERATEEYNRAAGMLNTAIIEYLARIALLGNTEDIHAGMCRLGEHLHSISGGSFVFMIAALGILVARMDAGQITPEQREALGEARRQAIASATLSEALAIVERCLQSIAGEVAESTLLGGEQLMQSARRYIDEHYPNAQLRIRDVAASVGLSQSYLSALFSKHVGESFTDYLIKRRMEQAQYLLLNTDMKTYEIASRVGYDNPAYFSALFKRYTGVTTSQFRESVNAL